MGGHLHHQPVAAATAVVVQPPPPPFPHHQPHFLGHQPAAARGGSAHGSESGDAVVARWLQSAGLQHLAAPLAASALDPRLLPGLLAQDHSRYGIQSLEDKQKIFKLGKTIGSVAESPIEHPATPSYAGSGNRSKMDGFLEIKEDFSPGLLDLHATDTELLSEGAGTGLFDSCSPFVPVTEHGFENGLDSLLFAGKQLSSRLQGPIERSPLRSTSTEKERGNKDNGLAKIKVVVRKRPLNKKELSRKEEDIISVEEQGCFLTVHEPKLKVDLTAYIEKHEFVFDAVLDGHVSNEEVYSVTVEPIVPTIFQRTKATCFAYGQTGSGKTYTMQPLPLKASQDILNMMQQPSYRNQGFQLWLSFFEIYGGKLFDLLNERSKLCMREDGRQQVCIVGLREFQVCDVELVKEYIEKGNAARSTGSTGANEESSRSHAILQLSLKKKTDRNEARPGRLVGKLSFIDLAGSERGADTTDNDRQTRLEGAEINKSLLALKECIRALDNDQGHIPFRGSKLTEVLRDSFVGDSRTVMISCISPNTGSCEHTLNTLRYADRVKGLSRSGNSKKDPYSSVPSQKDSAVSSQAQISSLEVLNIEEDLLAEDGRQTFRDDQDGASITSMDHRLYPNGDNNRMALPLNNIRDNYSSALGSTRDAPVGNFQEDQEQEKIHIVLPYRRKTSREGRPERPLNANEKEELHERGLKELTMSNVLHTSADDVVMVRPKDAQINALLKEEEELLSAHRKEVEDTIEIVREEMKLLGEVDQPGSRIDQYVTQLNEVLSRKAAGLLNFQARLARFQRLLKEQDVIGRSKALRQL